MRQYRVGLVGESNYQPAIRRTKVGTPVDLIHEPNNPHDKTAISARIPGGATIGYVPRDSWIKRAVLDEGWAMRARVGAINGEQTGNLGVVLDLVMLDDAEVEKGALPVFQDTLSQSNKPSKVAVKTQPGLISMIVVALLKQVTPGKGKRKGRRR